jgi:hypothetical protein
MERPPNPLEAEARRLRDAVYGEGISDAAWKGKLAREWMADIVWLREMSKRAGGTRCPTRTGAGGTHCPTVHGDE